MTWQHPFPKNTITSRFGAKESFRSNPHRGVDYAPGAKALIPAITDAVVTKIFFSKVLGWVCEIKSDEHGLYIGHSHLYCNKHDTIDCDGKDHDGDTCMKRLKVGDRVKRGQPVGRVASSGWSTGPHLHLTMSKQSDPRYAKVFDPEKFIDQKIKKQERLAKKAKKTEVTEKPQKPEQTVPDVTTPDKAQNPPKSVLEALRVIMAWFNK